MKQYTINATPERYDVSEEENSTRHNGYAAVVSEVLAMYGIDGFTIYEVVGYWHGERGGSYKIEVLTDKSFDVMVEVAEQLRRQYNQDAVILTCGDIVKFVER